MSNISWALDIETLDTESTAVILSIGLVPFATKIPLSMQELREKSFFVKFDAVQQQKRYNRTVSKDTLDWWATQPHEAKVKSLIPSANDLSAEDGLFELQAFFHSRGGSRNSLIYTRGNFDSIITESLCKAVGVKPLVPYYGFLDIRTFIHCMYPKSERGYVPIDTKICPDYDETLLVAHEPVDDCVRDICMMLAGQFDE
jgi:hypothetical protein